MARRDVSYRYPAVAREGRLYIAFAAALALLAHYYLGSMWTAAFAAAAVVLIFLFRDPSRRIPASPLGLVSPVDGVVTVVEEAHDPWLDRRAVHIGMRISPLGVFSVRSPLEGKVTQQWYPMSEQSNRLLAGCYAQWIHGDEGDDVVMAIHVSSLNRRPSCYVSAGERVGQGQRCGYVPFGTRLELFLPMGTRVGVEVGAKVRSGADIVATLIRR